MKSSSYISFAFPVILALIGLYLFLKSSRRMEEFDHVTGRISYIDGHFGKFKNDDYKFIQLEGNPTAYQFFIGKGKWDFKAEYENIDALKRNDTITIYSDDRYGFVNDTPEERLIDKHVRYVSKKGEIFFKEGDSGKLPAYLLFIASGISLLVLIFRIIKSR